jgi:cytochrome c oxidase subunit II
VAGRAVFADNNCGSCHTLADAGTNGTVGPNLDDGLAGRDEAFVRTSIVDPEAEIADGYQGGIMPPNYEQTLAPDELDALVTYLTEVTKGG